MGAAKQAMLEEQDNEPRVDCLRCTENVPISDAVDANGNPCVAGDKPSEQDGPFLCSYCHHISTKDD